VKRAGFTLLEAIIALMLLLLLAGGIAVVVRTAAHSAARAFNELAVERIVRTVALFVQHDLAEARHDELANPLPTRLRLPRPVAWGLACADDGQLLRVATEDWQASRTPEPGRDQLSLLADSTAEWWDSAAIIAVGHGSCPDGRPAVTLQTLLRPRVADLVRVVEPVEWSVYASGGADWFGLAPADHSSPVQPFAGPLRTGAARLTLLPTHVDVLVAPAAGAAITVTGLVTP
jgi:type II secretory pathway pseudopilin PulG